jgi:Protein of unknown function (DUF433)
MSFTRITIDPSRMNGLPCIRDTRVTLSAVLGQLAAERSFEEILEDYPYLGNLHVLCTAVPDPIRCGCTTASLGMMCTMRNTAFGLPCIGDRRR